MIGVDYGSSTVKWFDGQRFGTGLPQGGSCVVGLTSKSVLVKEAVFPLCKGKQLERMVLNEVVSDLSVEPSDIALTYCPVERLERGCRLLIFVEKRELLDSLPLKGRAKVTVDFIGAAVASSLLYPEGEVTVVDGGAGKVGVYRFKDGLPTAVEIVRRGYKKFIQRPAPLSLEGGRLILIGGGALDEAFRELFKEFNPELPQVEPFGPETPLYFNAYGLYHFKRARCRALFSQPSLFSSELFQKNKKLLLGVGSAVAASLLLLTAAEVIKVKAARDEYLTLKRQLKEELSNLLGQKVILPEVQIPQKLEELKRLKELLKVDVPSALLYLKAISDSVVKGVKVLEVKGSASSGQFTLKGRFTSEEALKAFTANLKERFEKLNLSVDGKRFTITLWGLKVVR